MMGALRMKNVACVAQGPKWQRQLDRFWIEARQF